jgi:anaerobic selenocysteine-containing dehydrogenase
MLANVGRLFNIPMLARSSPSGQPGAPDWFTLHLDPTQTWLSAWQSQPALPRAELHPRSARALGLRSGQTIQVTTSAGELRATLALNHSLQYDALVIAWARMFHGSSGLASGLGAAPLDLLGKAQNASGSLVFQGARAKVSPAG